MLMFPRYNFNDPLCICRIQSYRHERHEPISAMTMALVASTAVSAGASIYAASQKPPSGQIPSSRLRRNKPFIRTMFKEAESEFKAARTGERDILDSYEIGDYESLRQQSQVILRQSALASITGNKPFGGNMLASVFQSAAASGGLFSQAAGARSAKAGEKFASALGGIGTIGKILDKVAIDAQQNKMIKEQAAFQSKQRTANLISGVAGTVGTMVGMYGQLKYGQTLNDLKKTTTTTEPTGPVGGPTQANAIIANQGQPSLMDMAPDARSWLNQG